LSWMYDLYETYERCSHIVGDSADEEENTLLPIAHTTVMAHIEVTLDDDGTFFQARVIPKNEARTLIPCTESSAARAGSRPEAHPFSDKLQYVAKDFMEMGGNVTSGFSKEPTEPYHAFIDTLGRWCASEYSHPKACIVLKYLENGTIMHDLVNEGLLHIGVEGRMLTKAEAKHTGLEYPLISVLAASSEPYDAVIRWRIFEGKIHEAWKDKTLFNKWISFYESTQDRVGLCFITGKYKPLASLHPKKIRNDGDSAKLISSNDNEGFTFRGRFDSADQAQGVSFEVTQKAHNALRWLITRQGYQRGDFACVVWATSGKLIPQIQDDTDTSIQNDESDILDTDQNAGMVFRKKLNGYRSDLSASDRIVVLMLDSATPGRLAILYYQTLNGSELLEHIERWRNRCRWLHRYKSREVSAAGKKKAFEHYSFIGAPSTFDIVSVVYGPDANDKLKENGVRRILTCILEGLPPPHDMVNSAVKRASSPLSMENYEWKKALSIACSMYNGQNEKEGYSVALDTQRTSRDYLYGRLLAVADDFEQSALNAQKENRITNAQRYMNVFSVKPASTWLTISRAINPYQQKLAKWKREFYNNLFSAITDSFETGDFEKNTPLTGAFLLGYHSQSEWMKSEMISRYERFKEKNQGEEDGGNEA